MRLLWPQSLWHLLLIVLPVFADFNEFLFAGNDGNSSVTRTCPSSPYACNPPNVCAYDGVTLKWYCCGVGNTNAVCWAGSPACDGGSTTTPSGGQQSCASGTTKYCCLKDDETCTEQSGQFNICWSNSQNQLAPLNITRVNQTFLSLSSAHPSAASYTIAISSLLALTSTTATSSATLSSSSSASATSTSSASASASHSSAPSGKGLSGGAIGGIVVGVLGGLALAAVAGFLLWRRRKSNKSNPHAPADPYSAYGYQPGEMGVNDMSSAPPTTVKYGHESYGQPPPGFVQPQQGYVQPQEGYVAEAPADQAPVEMPGSHIQR